MERRRLAPRDRQRTLHRGTVWPARGSRPARPNVRDGGFRELLRRVDDVYHGTADDSAVNNEQGQKALYYAELHNLNRVWFKENILNDLEAHPRIAS
jgi:hypothetical protein